MSRFFYVKDSLGNVMFKSPSINIALNYKLTYGNPSWTITG